uniref:Uncharacterized protein n=1 Tax=Timema bartmani TaxID=61472 RepID=A0A7R9F4Q2_9NEOP|nr:unnamed protein product [Timema bartmani]
MSSLLFLDIVSSDEEVGTRSQEGLIRGYTYPVTAVKRVQVGETSLRHLFKGGGAVRKGRDGGEMQGGGKGKPPSGT